MNTIGNIFRFTGFGESHGVAVGGVIDGCPANLTINFEEIQAELNRRAGRTGDFSEFVSSRAKDEQDEIEWLSGLQDGVTLGTPIAFIIRNRQCRPADYDAIKDLYRPAHADYTYQCKYGIRATRWTRLCKRNRCTGGSRSNRQTTVAHSGYYHPLLHHADRRCHHPRGYDQSSAPCPFRRR